MNKIAIVYWSGTGNTKIMAEAIAEGVKESGSESMIFTTDSFNPNMISNYDGIAFGCPSMGAEVLEESEFEPLFTGCEAEIKNKNIVLFGSYGWGDGEWMRDWESRCSSDGANILSDPVICSGEPDSEAIHSCRDLGSSLAKAN